MTNWKIIGGFFAATIFFLLLLRWQGSSLITSYAPWGIVSLELCFDKAKALLIVNEWENAGLRGTVRMNLLLDYLLIPCYGLFLYSLCGYFSVHAAAHFLQRGGVLMAFGSLVAMFLDLVENILMFISTHIQVNGLVSFTTAVCATLKFVLIGLALFYCLISAVIAPFIPNKNKTGTT